MPKITNKKTASKPAKTPDSRDNGANDIVENALLPYLRQHHPDARMFILAGSFGRAMQAESQGNRHIGPTAPVETSDLDVLVVYDDVKNAGLHSATRQYDHIEYTPGPGSDKRKILVDMNVQDYASLDFQKGLQVNSWRNLFSLNMLAEGYALRDRDNRAGALKQDALDTIASGPAPLSRREAQHRLNQIARLEIAIRNAQTPSQRKILGLLTIRPAANLMLNMAGHWNSSLYQTNRYLRKYMPQAMPGFYGAFHELFDNDNPGKALHMLQALQTRVRQKLPGMQPRHIYSGRLASLPTALPPHQRNEIVDKTARFVIRHFCDALETAEKRGQENYIDTLAATMGFMIRAANRIDNDRNGDINHALRRVERNYPGFHAAFLDAFETRDHSAIRKIAGHMLKDSGGLEFEKMQIPFPADLARRRFENMLDKRRRKTKQAGLHKPRPKL